MHPQAVPALPPAPPPRPALPRPPGQAGQGPAADTQVGSSSGTTQHAARSKPITGAGPHSHSVRWLVACCMLVACCIFGVGGGGRAGRSRGRMGEGRGVVEGQGIRQQPATHRARVAGRTCACFPRPAYQDPARRPRTSALRPLAAAAAPPACTPPHMPHTPELSPLRCVATGNACVHQPQYLCRGHVCVLHHVCCHCCARVCVCVCAPWLSLHGSPCCRRQQEMGEYGEAVMTCVQSFQGVDSLKHLTVRARARACACVGGACRGGGGAVCRARRGAGRGWRQEC